MTLKDICKILESHAALSLQESYDNSGLLIGNDAVEVEKALITLDVTDQVLDEAIREDCGLVIAHHPLIFGKIEIHRELTP